MFKTKQVESEGLPPTSAAIRNTLDSFHVLQICIEKLHYVHTFFKIIHKIDNFNWNVVFQIWIVVWALVVEMARMGKHETDAIVSSTVTDYYTSECYILYHFCLL